MQRAVGGVNCMKTPALILTAGIAGVLAGLAPLAEAQEDTVGHGEVVSDLTRSEAEVLESIILICEDARRHPLHKPVSYM